MQRWDRPNIAIIATKSSPEHNQIKNHTSTDKKAKAPAHNNLRAFCAIDPWINDTCKMIARRPNHSNSHLSVSDTIGKPLVLQPKELYSPWSSITILPGEHELFFVCRLLMLSRGGTHKCWLNVMLPFGFGVSGIDIYVRCWFSNGAKLGIRANVTALRCPTYTPLEPGCWFCLTPKSY